MVIQLLAQHLIEMTCCRIVVEFHPSCVGEIPRRHLISHGVRKALVSTGTRGTFTGILRETRLFPVCRRVLEQRTQRETFKTLRDGVPGQVQEGGIDVHRLSESLADGAVGLRVIRRDDDEGGSSIRSPVRVLGPVGMIAQVPAAAVQ